MVILWVVTLHCILQKGEVVLDVPTKAILCLDNVPDQVREKLVSNVLYCGSPRLSLHGLLAAALFLKARPLPSPAREHEFQTLFEPANGLFDPVVWASSAPSFATFREGFPYLWPYALKVLLPGAVKAIVETQSSKIMHDYTVFNKGLGLSYPEPLLYPFPNPDTVNHADRYMHAWFLINSRSFYNLTDSTQRYPYDERLALLPLADLFNHTPSPGTINAPRKAPVSAMYADDGYTFTANQDISAGDEICISYGEHSNDFLLAEYGFFFFSSSSSGPASSPAEEGRKLLLLHNGGNPHDSISLCEGITDMLSPAREAKILETHRLLNASEDEIESVPGDKRLDALGHCSLAVAPQESKQKKKKKKNENGGDAPLEVLLSPLLQATLRFVTDDDAIVPDPATLQEWAPCPPEAEVVTRLVQMVKATQVRAKERLVALSKLNVKASEVIAKDMLSERWRQIEQTCQLALDILACLVEETVKDQNSS